MSDHNNNAVPAELEEYRRQIDSLDKEIIDALARRFEVVRKVGELKIRENMDAVQPVRAQAVKDAAVRMGEGQGLDPSFVRRLYDVLIDHAHAMEHDILDQGGA